MYDNAILKLFSEGSCSAPARISKKKKPGFSGAFVIEKDSIKSVFSPL